MGSWVVEMQAKLDNHRNGGSQEEQLGKKKPSIYKVPSFIISNPTKQAYQPRVVSFGPYHHGDPRLAQMEADKERALLHYVGRSRRSMQEVFEFVAQMAPDLKDSYDSLNTNWQDNKKFVQLMILDGCFMLEVLQQYYSDDDPVFSPHGDIYVLPFIKADMLLLENQLPMSLLLKLKYILEGVEPDIEDFNKSILWFLNYTNRDGKYPIMGKCLHVLDLYRKGLLLLAHNEQGNASPQSASQGASQSPDQGERKNERPPRYRSNDQEKNILVSILWAMSSIIALRKRQRPKLSFTSHDTIEDTSTGNNTSVVISRKSERVGHNVVRPAIELHEAGVHFMKSDQKSLRDITFDFNSGILKLPIFIVDDYTKSTFLNLIAFERCHIPAGSHITSFVAFMDRIIDDSRDIKFLSSKGIINNFIGSDKEAANLFNTISTMRDLDVEMNDNLYGVYMKLIDYSNTDWNKWRANLTETYFRSPWAIVSILAAFILFSLTAVQTIFTILS